MKENKIKSKELAEYALNKAKLYHSLNKEENDQEEVIKLFQIAINAGSAEACWYLGVIYYHEINIEDSFFRAMHCHYLGSQAGWIDCFAAMGFIFSSDEIQKNMKLSNKFWEHYFNKSSSNSDNKVLGNSIDYLLLYMENNWGITCIKKIKKIQKKIITLCEDQIAKYENISEENDLVFTVDKARQIISFLK